VNSQATEKNIAPKGEARHYTTNVLRRSIWWGGGGSRVQDWRRGWVWKEGNRKRKANQSGGIAKGERQAHGKKGGTGRIGDFRPKTSVGG